LTINPPSHPALVRHGGLHPRSEKQTPKEALDAAAEKGAKLLEEAKKKTA